MPLRSSRCAARVLAFVAHTALLSAALPAGADDPTQPSVPGGDLGKKFAIDEAHPERSLPSRDEAMKNPLEMGYLMMDLIARAESASQRGDHAAAVRYYRAVARAVPERATAFSKLCQAYARLGDREHALESCKQALSKPGTSVEDHTRFVQLALATEGDLTRSAVDDVDAVIAHLEQALHADAAQVLTVAGLRCELAARLEDPARLRACTDTLATLAPRDARTLTYRWALALSEQDLDEAQTILSEARQAKLSAAALSRMESGLAAARTRPGSWVQKLRGPVLGAGFALLIAVVLAFTVKRRPRALAG